MRGKWVQEPEFTCLRKVAVELDLHHQSPPFRVVVEFSDAPLLNIEATTKRGAGAHIHLRKTGSLDA